MRRLLAISKTILGLAAHPAKSVTFIGSDLRQFIWDGGISIETPFEYQSVREGDAYRFRTTMQLDADIINIMPDPGLYPGNPDWQDAFKGAYQTHQEKLQRFVSQLDGIRILAWMIGTIISTLLVVSTWQLGPSEIHGYTPGWGYLILWLISAYTIRRYALSAIVPTIMRVTVWWARKRSQCT